MHVVIDGSVVRARMKGAGRVVMNLARALPLVDRASRYSIVAFPEGAAALHGRAGGAAIVQVTPVSGIAWERRVLARVATELRADAVLTLREIVVSGGPPTLMHLAEPPAYRLRSGVRDRPTKHVAKDLLLQAMLRSSIRNAAAVTAASSATATWLRRRYGIDPPVIPPGIDPFFLEAGVAPGGPPYLLHPATGDRRENTDLVLRAYASSKPPATLALVGTPPQEAATLARRAKSLGIPPEAIQIHGWVSDGRLRDLYCGAVALVHPARYEGFVGLQPLEAMAQGTPVIALAAPGVTEALGDIAKLAPDDVPGLGAAMNQLCDDDVRLELGSRGQAFATALTWERAARRFVDVLRALSRPLDS